MDALAGADEFVAGHKEKSADHKTGGPRYSIAIVSLLLSVIGHIISPYLTDVLSSASFPVSRKLRGGKHAAYIFELRSEAPQRS